VRVLFQAFVAGIPVPGDALARALGCRDLEEWLGAGLLDPAGEGRVRAPFRFICVGNAALLVDPLDQRFHNRIHLGQDSVAMCDFLAQLDPPRGRILDVGTGSGVVLINEARRGTVDAAVGVDINPRAVVMASLNARINGVTTHVSEQDIFAAGTAVGHFDRITWNAPFRFMPDTERNDNIDGFGGRLGIGLTLDFVGVLPRLLREGGEAVVMSAGPRMSDGRRPLDEELATVASRAGLDVEVHVQGMFFDARWRDFHRSHGVEGFESVILRLRAGSGRISRIGPGPAVRVVDGIRRLVHAVRQL
jgi:methylase of polypeptide subunit release factors